MGEPDTSFPNWAIPIKPIKHMADMMTQSANNAILSIKGLKTHFETRHGTARAVNDVSLEVHAGDVLGLVGESGCGKSALAMSIMQLLPSPPAHYAGGKIEFKGQNLLDYNANQIRRIRGNQIGMIFQEPMSALNPVFTIGNQLAEVFRIHQGLAKAESRKRCVEMLEMVGVSAPQRRIKEYPFQLSGGMRQRVMIAMALACRPALLIADEPTTALDVTIQAQILELMTQLRIELGTAILLITHDLGVIAESTDRVAVMYTGRVVERASTHKIFQQPMHPYTRGLMAAIPSSEAGSDTGPLTEIDGVVPSLFNLPQGCTFAPRCPQAADVCRQQTPELKGVETDHHVACWMVDDA